MARSRHERLETLAARVKSARRALASARNQLGRLTTPDDPPVIVEHGSGALVARLQERGKRFVDVPGVLGFAVGYVRTNKVEASTPCLTIYVSRKFSPQALKKMGRRKLPRHVQVGGRRIRVDVVALGSMQRNAFAGQSLSTKVGIIRRGTIGAGAVGTPDGEPLLITAMHVIGLRTFPDPGAPPVPVFVPAGSASRIGLLRSGTQIGIDAATVAVDTSLSNVIPQIGQLSGWRSVLLPGDRGTRVRMFGAQSRRVMDGVIEEPLVVLPAFGLDMAIVVRGFESVEGDSGAALVDPQNLVLGFLVGATTSGRRIFSPAGLVLKRLGCNIPSVP